jgi:alkylhydroperoxidase family enzyme
MASGKAKENSLDEKEALAKSFALLVAESPKEIDDEIFKVLKEVFSDEEISELLAFVCFINASQTFGAVLSLTST